MGIYSELKKLHHKLLYFSTVNWVKTLYFNFKMFPFDQAKKLPVFFYGKVKFQRLTGKVIINAPLQLGMIGFGQRYEMNTVHRGTAELKITGTLIFNGYVQFGKDYFLYVGDNACCEFGNMNSLATNSKTICTNSIVIGNYVQTGADSQIIDTNFHPMENKITGEKYPVSGPIKIGSYIYTGSRVSIMQKTVLPDYCSVASNSLCNRDYSHLEPHSIIGGLPAELRKSNVGRDWESEKADMERWLVVTNILKNI